jgi:hypothetical protein
MGDVGMEKDPSTPAMEWRNPFISLRLLLLRATARRGE